MASKPSVTLTFAGDEKKLTDAFDRVGAASKQMADRVDSASNSITSHTKRFDEMGEKAGTTDTRMMGFRDTITGLQDSFKGLSDPTQSFQDRLLTLGFGVGDLASGFENVLLPAMSSMVTFMKGPLSTAMTFIAEHPLLITLGLLAAAVIFLIAQTDWFQKVATSVFNWVGHLVQDVFGAAVNWVVGAWNGVLDFFDRLPERIGSALGSLGSWIGNAFKAGLNVVIDVLNWFVDRANDIIYGINVISPFDDIPYIPHIARLHTGGIFHTADGSGEGLALLKDGERVSAPGQGGGGGPYQISAPLVEQIQAWFTDGTLELVGR